jgi:phenylpyruvate tautomerase PptA (4-oxalocrotonate tautomerase family)
MDADDLTKNLDKKEKRGIVTDVVAITTKLIRYSKGGLNATERRDLAKDLTELAAKLLVDAID